MLKKITPVSNYSTIKYIVLGVVGFIPAIFLILFLLPRPTFKTCFPSLPLVEQYALSLPEKYEMDNENTIKPEFTKLWATMTPTKLGLIKKQLTWLGTCLHLAKPPIWSPSVFKYQLAALTAAREAAGFKGDTVIKITATAQTKIVVFGYVQGAIHSLARCLAELKKLGMINDDLVLTSPDLFIVFTGGIVSRSPYNMATLNLVGKLMEKNPQQVLYLRGTHETNGYWQEHALKNELVTFASHLGKGDVPLADTVNAFFKTLPLAAYITLNGSESKEFIRISDAGRGQNKQLEEALYAGFLTSKSDKPVAVHDLATKDDGNAEVKISIIFKGEKKRESYQPHDGLRLLPPDMDSVAWATLSCPTVVYQKAIKFMHDAFVVLTAGKQTADWTATLYNRDVRTTEPFKATVFNLLTGANVATGDKPTAPEEKEEKQGKKEVVQAAVQDKTEKPVTQATAPVVTKEHSAEQHVQTVALDTASSSTMAHVAAIEKQLQALTKDVADLVSSVRKQDVPAQESAPISAEKKDALPVQKVAPAKGPQEAEESAFKPL